MEIKVLASGSSGNAYIIEDGYHKLLIECGIPFNQMVKAIWNEGKTITMFDGCLISHSHLDHAKSVKDLLKRGIECYMSAETAEELGVKNHHRTRLLPCNVTIDINGFLVRAFEGLHDVPCIGFLIASEHDKLVYLTDSAYSPYIFPGLIRIMIGCNYDLDILKENVESGHVDKAEYKRLMHSHASLDTVKEFLKSNDLSALKEVHLIHVSKRNGDPEKFKREIQQLVGVPTYIAEKGA